MQKRRQGSPAALRPGTVLGGFRVEEVLGAGGMGVVYRAIQVSLDREVALKVLSEELASDPSARRRFVQEGILAARVVHPNVVRVLDVAEQEGRLLLAYELIVGGTLRQRLDRDGRLPVPEAIELCATCADVLALLHGAGILHRDLKPANIFLSPGRGPLVGDLGIAKDLVVGRLVTQAGLLLGTPAYIAPEMVRGLTASATSDLYALGVVLFECLTGRVPFEGDDPGETLRRHLAEPAPDPCSFRPELPADYTALMCRALAKEPAGRFPDAKAFAHALRHLPPPGPAPSAVRPAEPTRTLKLRPGQLPSKQSPSATVRLEGPAGATTVRPRRGREWFLWGPAILLAAGGGFQLLMSLSGEPSRPSPDAVARQAATAATLSASQEGTTTRPARPAIEEIPHWHLAPSRVDDESAWPRLDTACRRLRSGAAALVALNRDLRRRARTLDPEQALVETLAVCDPMAEAVGNALQEMAPLVAIGKAGAARRTGELLACLALVFDECRNAFRFTLGVWVTEAVETDLVMNGMRLPPLLDRLGRRLGSRAYKLTQLVSRPMFDSDDPSLRGGLVCLRAIELRKPDAVPRQRLEQETFDAARTCLEQMVRPPRPPGPDALVARALLRSIWSLQPPTEAMKATLSTLQHLRQPPGPGPVDPLEELLVLKLLLECHLLAEPYLGGTASRQEAMTRRLDDTVAVRNRLTDRWPYDPHRPPPTQGSAVVREAAGLHFDVQFGLAEAEGLARGLARQLGVPLAGHRRQPAPGGTAKTR